jgi:putative intracellular protease/amidase
MLMLGTLGAIAKSRSSGAADGAASNPDHDKGLHLVAKSLAPVTSDTGVTITPTVGFADCPADLTVLFAPGGTQGTLDAMTDPDTEVRAKMSHLLEGFVGRAHGAAGSLGAKG